MPKKYLIIDHCIRAFQGDRILEPEYAAQFPGATVLSSLTRQARERGWEVHTADVFLERVHDSALAVCLSNEFTPEFHQLVSNGVIPGLLISGESPNVARKFYQELPGGSFPFAHACLFRGSLKRLHKNCTGHQFLWPCPVSVLKPEKPWDQRSLLGMVAAYKRAWAGLRALPKEFIPRILWKIIQWRQPTLRLKDLYNLRIKLAQHYGLNKEFRLYGYGWAEAMDLKYRPWRPKFRFAKNPSACKDKLAALGDCRFSLILENCIYPGYVTEKIFDAFRAGSVPVYLGAPDIEDFVPPDCFIDYRRFPDPDTLWNELSSMPQTRWNEYRQAISAFLLTPQYCQHLEDNVARQWLNWLEEAAAHQ